MNSLLVSLGKISLKGLSTSSAFQVNLNLRNSISTTSNKNGLFNQSLTPTNKLLQSKILCPSESWSTQGQFLGGTGTTSILISQLQVRYRRVYITRSRRFPGHIDIYGEEDGKRQSLKAAEERFRRLDWGVYIRTRVGKDNKRWKMTDRRKWRKENHIFAAEVHNSKLDRMFANETKRARYIPDDPFEKFNRLAWWKHHWTQLKNQENIRLYGSNVYRFNRYKTHLSLNSKYNVLPKMYYMPPGYLANVASNPAKVYTADTLIPEVDVAPHFQREHNRSTKIKINKELYTIRDLEQYSGDLPIWSPLFFPTRNPE